MILSDFEVDVVRDIVRMEEGPESAERVKTAEDVHGIISFWGREMWKEIVDDYWRRRLL